MQCPLRFHELITRARARAADRKFPLLVGTSYGGGTVPSPSVVKASDFLLIHGNGVREPAGIVAMVRQARQVAGYRPMPILFNEDDHFDFDKPANNFTAAVSEYASWGYFDYRMKGEGFDEGYQSVPVNWKTSSARKQGFFKLLSAITGEKPWKPSSKSGPLVARTLVENGPTPNPPPVSWYTILVCSCQEVKDGQGGRVCTHPPGARRREARRPRTGTPFSPLAAQDPRDPRPGRTRALPPRHAAVDPRPVQAADR